MEWVNVNTNNFDCYFQFKLTKYKKIWLYINQILISTPFVGKFISIDTPSSIENLMFCHCCNFAIYIDIISIQSGVEQQKYTGISYIEYIL